MIHFVSRYNRYGTSGPEEPINSKVSRSQNLRVLSTEPAKVFEKDMEYVT